MTVRVDKTRRGRLEARVKAAGAGVLKV